MHGDRLVGTCTLDSVYSKEYYLHRARRIFFRFLNINSLGVAKEFMMGFLAALALFSEVNARNDMSSTQLTTVYESPKKKKTRQKLNELIQDMTQ